MTQNEMIEIAECEYAHRERAFEPLLSFAKIVAAKEREACVKICEKYGNDYYCEHITDKLSKAIRARGQT